MSLEWGVASVVVVVVVVTAHGDNEVECKMLLDIGADISLMRWEDARDLIKKKAISKKYIFHCTRHVAVTTRTALVNDSHTRSTYT